MVIVSDKYLEVKNNNKVEGLLRIVLYLEDLGIMRKKTNEIIGLPQI